MALARESDTYPFERCTNSRYAVARTRDPTEVAAVHEEITLEVHGRRQVVFLPGFSFFGFAIGRGGKTQGPWLLSAGKGGHRRFGHRH